MTASLVEVVQESPSDRGEDGHILRASEIAVIREMLATFESLTVAGQRHVMEKVVSFVDARARGAAGRMSHRNRVTLSELLTQLQKESQRMMPDPCGFARRAENLIALLDAVG